MVMSKRTQDEDRHSVNREDLELAADGVKWRKVKRNTREGHSRQCRAFTDRKGSRCRQISLSTGPGCELSLCWAHWFHGPKWGVVDAGS